MNRLCPICSSTEKTHLYEQNFNNKAISLMESYDVVACRDCGFAFADNIPSQEEFDSYYAGMSKYEFNHNDGVVSSAYIDHFNKIVDFIIPHLDDKNARIVDIGCSTGCLLSLFKQKGYTNLLGVDPSPSCVRTVKELYDIDSVVNTISDFYDDEGFDLIILSAVLEHIVDFDDSLRKIRSLLKDRGLLFIEIPDAERFDSFITAPFQQFSVEHINYFSQYSIRNLLSMFSFQTLDMQQHENKVNQIIDPDIFNISSKTEEKNCEIIRDDISELKIRDYINQCSKIDAEVKETIRAQLSDKDKIIVWGTGTHTLRLIGSGLELSKVSYFVDSNKRYVGKKLNGIDIRLPGDIREQDIPILISTYSYQQEIADQIRNELRLNNEIVKIY